MQVFITSMVILSSVLISIVQIVRNIKSSTSIGMKPWLAPCVLLICSMALGLDLIVSGGYSPNMSAALMPALVAMNVLNSSLSVHLRVYEIVLFIMAFDVALVLYYIAYVSGVPLPHLSGYSDLLIYLMTVIMVVLFVYALIKRLKSVKCVMKTSTVWAYVALAVDSIYLILTLIAVSIHPFSDFISLCVMGGILVASGVRALEDSIFVLWRKQEQCIIESLKVTKVESAMDSSSIDDVYKDIYERIVSYFELEKPFLDCDLTINDLVKVIYSNKLYISRAISQFTGRNFCQFVNYYRITYAMECFRNNPELKNHELATMSGFNSIVSYNMAFRLFMGENPSEWCKKEKNRKVRSKK